MTMRGFAQLGLAVSFITVCATAHGQQGTRDALVLELSRLGKAAEAIHLQKGLLERREQGLGPAHPEVAASLNRLALLYHDNGNLTEAELVSKRALDIRDKSLPNDDPSIAESLNTLGTIYLSQGWLIEAESPPQAQPCDTRKKTWPR